SRILELMNKKHKSMNKNEIKEILVMLKKVNVHIGLHIIIGFPTETSLEAQETLDFLIENKDLYDVAWPQPFVLEEGTPIFKDFKHFSIIRIYREDKNYGERLGYSYDTVSSLNDKELVYSNAVKTLREINKIEIKLGFYTLFLNR
ncbi:MAG: hypothetical protein KJ880_08620, partial [Candidatus Omnitrophica bacterium]|nr:hypothetical protein [Candidatus Omnitrophota bacterium]